MAAFDDILISDIEVSMSKLVTRNNTVKKSKKKKPGPAQLPADIILPGDHVSFKLSDGRRTGILVELTSNAPHGLWARVWTPEVSTGPRMQDTEGGICSLPLSDLTRVLGPRG